MNKQKRLLILITGTAVLLLIPLLTMLFTDEVQWSLMDFAVAAELLLTTAIIFEIVMRTIKTRRSRIVLIIGLLTGFLLLWLELAVGIFNSPLAGS